MRRTASVPVLVALAGLTGSGKSTLSLALGRTLGWPVLDKDTLKTGLLARGVPEETAAHASYSLMFDLARDLLVDQGLPVILDSPLLYPVAVERVQEIAALAGAPLKVVLLLAGGNERIARTSGRLNRLSQTGVILPDEDDGLGRFTHLPAEALRLDSTRTLAELLASALAYLGKTDQIE